MSVRQVSNRGGNIIGHFPFIRTRQMVPYESTIERDFLYVANHSPGVTAIEAQPLCVEYWHEGKRHYTPDFLVGMADRDLLIECKRAVEVGTEENRRKWEAARRLCYECHWEFVVVTERQLRTGPCLQNIKLLTQFARHSVLPQVRTLIFGVLMSHTEEGEKNGYCGWVPLTIDGLASRIAPEQPQSAISSIMHLAFHRQLIVPLDTAPLGGGSSIWLPRYPPPASSSSHAPILPTLFTIPSQASDYSP